MYYKSKYFKDYCIACEEARKNIHDNEEYAKCIRALNSWMDWKIIEEGKRRQNVER